MIFFSKVVKVFEMEIWEDRKINLKHMYSQKMFIYASYSQEIKKKKIKFAVATTCDALLYKESLGNDFYELPIKKTTL